MNFKIRPLQVEDMVTVAAIERESFSKPWSEEELFKCVKLANYRFFVAEEDGRVVGYAGLLTCLDEADLTTVAVTEAYRRRGIARALLEEIQLYAREREIRYLFLEVRASNQPARALYEKCGFQEVGRRKDYYQDPVEDAILMKYERRWVC